MEDAAFVDYYEILEASPNANAATLVRMFRYLAQRYHPDNPETGDALRFNMVLEAHNALKDPDRRAEYDRLHGERQAGRPHSPADARGDRLVERDVEIQEELLSLFYVRRRQNIREPGVPEFELERRFDCAIEMLEFHLWYLQEKHWIGRLDNGMFAITVAGIDHINAEHQRKETTKLLMDRNRRDGG